MQEHFVFASQMLTRLPLVQVVQPLLQDLLRSSTVVQSVWLLAAILCHGTVNVVALTVLRLVRIRRADWSWSRWSSC